MDGGVALESVEELPKADGPWPLPQGWTWVTFGAIAKLRREKVHPLTAPDLRFVGMDDIEPGGTSIIQTRPFGTMKSAGNRFQRNDVLYGRLRPYLNKTAIAEAEGACSGELLAITPSVAVDPKFVQLFMHARRFVNAAMGAVSGDRPRIDFTTIAAFDFPLAPLAEQRRIVARVDELFAEIAEGEAALAAAREGLDIFRRALLKAAVAGELTKDWRSLNPATETGHDVVACISKDHATVPNKSRERRGANVAPVDIDVLPALPEGWTWTALEDLITAGPTNGYSPKKSTDGSGTLALKLTATTRGKIDLADGAVKSLSETIVPGSDLFLKPGDLLFQRGNTIEYVGIAAIYEGPSDKYIYPDLMIRVRTASARMTEWIWRFANSPFGRKYMMESASGTAGTMPKISGKILRNFPVPIPPSTEADEILRRVSEALAAFADTITMLDAEAADAARLKQSVLKAAFEGRLVPQDPADEPATMLLAQLATDHVSARARSTKEKSRQRIRRAAE